jgi:hypothetical protein
VSLAFASWALAILGLLTPQASAPAGTPSLDYDVFKSKIEPIFVAKRPGHARCISCHTTGTPFRLQKLEPGATTWTEDESRKNFEAVKREAIPGNLKSRILIHPLAEEAGGDFFHNGGKHWQSQNDPEWQTLKAWIMGSSR